MPKDWTKTPISDAAEQPKPPIGTPDSGTGHAKVDELMGDLPALQNPEGLKPPKP